MYARPRRPHQVLSRNVTFDQNKLRVRAVCLEDGGRHEQVHSHDGHVRQERAATKGNVAQGAAKVQILMHCCVTPRR